MNNKKMLATAIISTFSLGLISAANACTRILWDTESHGTFVTRTMDWSEQTNPHLLNIPKNTLYLSHLDNVHKVASKYDVTGITGYGQLVDGMNSAGLSGNLLYDRGMVTQAPNSQQDIGALTYLKHVLSQFSSVSEAVEFMKATPAKTEFIEGVPVKISVHFSFQDVSGDSAIVEFREDDVKIWHGSEYTVMTNQPDYSQHLANVERAKRGWGALAKQYSQTNLSTGGNTNPEDRFIHATYFSGHLKEPTSIVNGLLKLDSTSFKIPHDAPNVSIGGVMAGYATEYSNNMHLQSGESIMRYQWGEHFSQFSYNIKDIQASGKSINFELLQPDLIGKITDKVLQSTL